MTVSKKTNASTSSKKPLTLKKLIKKSTKAHASGPGNARASSAPGEVKSKQPLTRDAATSEFQRFMNDLEAEGWNHKLDAYKRQTVAIECPCCDVTAESKKCEVTVGDRGLMIYCHKCNANHEQFAIALSENGIALRGSAEARKWMLTARIWDQCYREVLSRLKRSKRHGDAMRARGFRTAALGQMLVKTSNASQIIKFECDSLVGCIEDNIDFPETDNYRDREEMIIETIKGIPGFRTFGDKVTFCFPKKPGMVYPLIDEHGLVSRIRIRYDNPDAGGKYAYVGRASDGHKPSCIHFPLLTRHRIRDLIIKRAPVEILVTEGELKAEHTVRRFDMPVISMPGVQSYKAAIAKATKKGAYKIHWAFDADHRTNPHVAKAMINAVGECMQKAVSCSVWLWDEAYKGIDDLPPNLIDTIKVITGPELTSYLTDLAAKHETAPADERPRIILSPDTRFQAAEQILEQLAKNGFYRTIDGKICRRNEEFARVDANDDVGPFVVIEKDEMLAQIDRFCLFANVVGEGKTKSASCSSQLSTNAYARSDYQGMPRIQSVLYSPGILRSGRIATVPGYDPETQSYLVSVPKDWDQTAVHQNPTREQAQEAYSALAKPLCDFAFVDEAGVVGVIAALITMVARQAFDDTVPVFSFAGDKAGAGKSTLASSIAHIAFGCKPATSGYSREDSEMEKVITANLKGFSPYIWLDNIPAGEIVKSPSLARLVTASVWKGRKLQTSDVIVRKNYTTVLFTGNDIRYTYEIARRVIAINIRWQERTTFTTGELSDYAKTHQASLLASALTLWSWLKGRTPQASDPAPIKSFSTWCRIVGNGLLELTGLDVRSLVKTDELDYDADRLQANELIAAIVALRPTHYANKGATAATRWFKSMHLHVALQDSIYSPAERKAAISVIKSAFGSSVPTPNRLGIRLAQIAFVTGDEYTLVMRRQGNMNEYRLMKNDESEKIQKYKKSWDEANRMRKNSASAAT